jgi:hypothetical protein
LVFRFLHREQTDNLSLGGTDTLASLLGGSLDGLLGGEDSGNAGKSSLFVPMMYL